MTRREHIEQLAVKMQVDILYTGARYQMGAHSLFRYLILAPWGADVPESELYWVSLHELGHIATTKDYLTEMDLWPSGEREDWQKVEVEARAWQWALDHSRFPIDQAAESAIAWGMTDYMRDREIRASVALQELYDALGSEPDWFMNVTTEDHWIKLDGWARPNWKRLGETLAAVTK